MLSRYVECHVSFIVMLCVVMLNVVMLNVVMLNVVLLSVIMLIVFKLNVVGPIQPNLLFVS
jgi:hypothetical protein